MFAAPNRERRADTLAAPLAQKANTRDFPSPGNRGECLLSP